MNKTSLYIGLNDKDTKAQKIDTLEATKIVYNLLLSYGIDGATIYNATGIYKHDNGEVVIENTLRVELIEAPAGAVFGAIHSIKKALNQEAIVLQQEQITSQFI